MLEESQTLKLWKWVEQFDIESDNNNFNQNNHMTQTAKMISNKSLYLLNNPIGSFNIFIFEST